MSLYADASSIVSAAEEGVERDAGLDAGVRTDLLTGGVELGIGSDIPSSTRGGDMEVDDGMGKSRYLASDL
jgi:hypothetical protein